jgi:hypothetical protein
VSNRQIKLGAVVGGPGQHYRWLDPEIPGDASANIDWYIELAELAKFDLIFIVDSQFITADSPPHYLNLLEPLTLLSALAVTTRHIGLVGTLTTSYNDPFSVARRLASLDLISGGRAGWNVVTSGDAGTAGNFSRDEHYDYDTRYGRGLEFVQVARGLWDSYEDDAFPRDRRTWTFLDQTRLHALNHRGEHFSVAGPLNISRSRQGQPVIFQAGAAGHLPGRRLRTGPRPGSHDRRGHLHELGRPFGCPYWVSAACSAPSTRPTRCEGTWAYRCRRPPHPGPPGANFLTRVISGPRVPAPAKHQPAYARADASPRRGRRWAGMAGRAQSEYGGADHRGGHSGRSPGSAANTRGW